MRDSCRTCEDAPLRPPPTLTVYFLSIFVLFFAVFYSMKAKEGEACHTKTCC